MKVIMDLNTDDFENFGMTLFQIVLALEKLARQKIQAAEYTLLSQNFIELIKISRESRPIREITFDFKVVVVPSPPPFGSGQFEIKMEWHPDSSQIRNPHIPSLSPLAIKDGKNPNDVALVILKLIAGFLKGMALDLQGKSTLFQRQGKALD